MKIALQQFKPSPWQYVLGLLSALVFLGGLLNLVVWYGFNNKAAHMFLGFTMCTTAPALIFMCAFLSVKMVVVDTVKKTIHSERRFLFLKLPRAKKPLPEIDYVSAFCQLQIGESARGQGREIESHIYDVNLWHGTHHIFLCSQYTAEEALHMARQLAEALHCGLLDATDPYNKVWLKEV
jgi:hypothetical protein